MKNATLVYIDGIWESSNTTHVLRVWAPKKGTFWVNSFENGIATISPMPGCTIHSFAKVVADCFDESSNFANELLEAFNCDEGTIFTGIKFDFNGVSILVTKKNADANKIYSE